MAHKAVEMKRSERSDAEIQLSKQVVQTFPSKRFGPRKLRLYIAVVWFLWLGLTLLQVFYGPKA